VKRLSVNEVNEILLAEKKTAKLTKLDPHFMIKLNDTIGYLGQKRQEALKEESSTAFDIYDDELKKIKKLRNQILDIREKKIMGLAWSAREAAKPKLRSLLPNERKLYDVFVEILMHWRRSLKERKEFEPELFWEQGGIPGGDHTIQADAEEDAGSWDMLPKEAQRSDERITPEDHPGEARDHENDESVDEEPEEGPTNDELTDDPVFEERPAGDARPEDPGDTMENVSADDEPGFQQSMDDGDGAPGAGAMDLEDVTVIGIISDDIKPFVDEKEQAYYLKKGDVATVPRVEAQVLIRNKLAKEIHEKA